MTVDQLYEYIITQMTPEEALKKMLTAQLFQFEQLKVLNGHEGEVHPLFVLIQCAFEMGWSTIALDQSHETVQGVIVGTPEYVKQWTLADKTEEE